MIAPEITAALRELIATTPPPVTVWGVRYTELVAVAPAGGIVWLDSEAEAREWLADEQDAGYRVELVRIAGRVHVEG